MATTFFCHKAYIWNRYPQYSAVKIGRKAKVHIEGEWDKYEDNQTRDEIEHYDVRIKKCKLTTWSWHEIIKNWHDIYG